MTQWRNLVWTLSLKCSCKVGCTKDNVCRQNWRAARLSCRVHYLWHWRNTKIFKNHVQVVWISVKLFLSLWPLFPHSVVAYVLLVPSSCYVKTAWNQTPTIVMWSFPYYGWLSTAEHLVLDLFFCGCSMATNKQRRRSQWCGCEYGHCLGFTPNIGVYWLFLIHDCLIHFKLPMLHKENADLKGSTVTEFAHPTTEGDIELVLRECDSGQVEGKQPNKRTHWLKTFCSFLAFIRDR